MVLIFPIQFSITASAYTPTWGGDSDYGSGAEGAYVAIRYLYGEDQIPGFRKRLDTVSMVVQASMGANTTVSTSNLEAYYSGYALGQFQSCSLASGQSSIYECSFTEDNDTGPASPATQTYTAKLVNYTEVLSQTSAYMVVDAQEPTVVTINTYEQGTTNPITTTSDENISVYFDVKDYAYSGQNGVGIRKITLTAGGSNYYTYPSTNSSNNNTCTGIVTISRKYDTVDVYLGSTTGSYPICVYAEDCFGQYIQECETIYLDKDAPMIVSSSFEVNNASGDPAEWLSAAETSLEVYMEFNASDLDQSSIYGDFSDAHSDGDYDRVYPSGTCALVSQHTYGCTFNTKAKINASDSYTFTFYASDTLGNEASASMTYSLKYDATGPVATGLTTPDYYNGHYYIGTNDTNITVSFTESGVGMNASYAYLDLSNIGQGSKQADNCTPTWSCKWYDYDATNSPYTNLPYLTKTVNINGTNYTYNLNARQAEVSVKDETSDDLGNTANKTRYNLTVDIFPPIISYTNITPIHASSDYGNYTVVGDSIYIFYNITDGSYVNMNITADEFVNTSGGFTDEVTCTDNGDGVHSCSYTFGPITEEGFYNGSLKIAFIDMLGNQIADTQKVAVYEIDDSNTSYWTATNEGCSPDPLDRELVSRMASNIYCQIKLSSSYSADIYDLTSASVCCNDTGATGTYASTLQNSSTLSTASWMGLPRNEETLYLSLTTTTFSSRIDSLNYECEVKVRTVVDNEKITKNFETVEVDFNIGLYNSPLNEVNQSIWDQIEDLHDTYLDDGWEIIGQLQRFFELCQKICNIYYSIQQIASAWRSLTLTWDSITSGIHALGEGMTALQFVTRASALKSAEANHVNKGGQATFDAQNKGLYGFFQKYCAFISCKLKYKWIAAWQQGVVDFFNWWTTLGYGVQPSANQDSTYEYGYWGVSDGGPTWKGTVLSSVGDYLESEAAAINSMSDGSEKTSRINEFNELNSYHTATYNSLNRDTDETDTPADSGTNTAFTPTIAGRTTSTDTAANTAGNTNTGGTSTDQTLGEYWTSWNAQADALSSNIPIKENYVLSVLTLCIPGIIYNLEKYRQIQCAYGNCLATYGQSSLPISLCAENKDYAECQYFWGPVFQLVPFSQFLSNLQRLIANIMEDPYLLVDIVLGYLCNAPLAASTQSCMTGPSTTCALTGWGLFTCNLYDTINLVSDVWEDLQGYTEDDYFDVDLDEESGSCGSFQDSYDSLEDANVT